MSGKEYDTPEKRDNALKELIIHAIAALRNLQVVSTRLEDQTTNTTIQRYIDDLKVKYFQITKERISDSSDAAGTAAAGTAAAGTAVAGTAVAGPAVTRDMNHGGGRHHRIHKSSVQRRKHHHSNKKGKTVRRKMTRTRR
jgi:predicted aminopeptidase